MKKSCLGCLAFDSSFMRCELGFKTIQYDIAFVPGSGLKPIEECPKPKTIKEFYELLMTK